MQKACICIKMTMYTSMAYKVKCTATDSVALGKQKMYAVADVVSIAWTYMTRLAFRSPYARPFIQYGSTTVSGW